MVDTKPSVALGRAGSERFLPVLGQLLAEICEEEDHFGGFPVSQIVAVKRRRTLTTKQEKNARNEYCDLRLSPRTASGVNHTEQVFEFAAKGEYINEREK